MGVLGSVAAITLLLAATVALYLPKEEELDHPFDQALKGIASLLTAVGVTLIIIAMGLGMGA